MSDKETVPVSHMGIGDEEIESELERHAENIFGDQRVKATEVKSDILAGVAHVRVEMVEGVPMVPKHVQNYIIAEDLRMFDPMLDGDVLSFRLTVPSVYETWSEMETPDL